MLDETKEHLHDLSRTVHIALDELIAETDGGDPDSDIYLLSLLGDLYTAVAQARFDHQALIADVYDFNSPGRTLVTDEGTVKRNPPRQRTRWDSALLLDKLMTEASLADIIDAAGIRTRASHNWKTSKLKELDIDPDDYRETEQTGPATASLMH